MPVKPSYLFRHHQKYHTENPKKYSCPTCAKDYLAKGRLENHVKSNHPTTTLNFEQGPAIALREVMCDSCEKTFVTEERMMEHKAYKHIVDPISYSCLKCKKSFDNQRVFKQHTQKNHLDLPCNFCQKKLGSTLSLKTHKKAQHKELV